MKSHLVGSSTSAPSTSAVNYNSITCAGSGSFNATETNRGSVVPHAMTLDQLRVTVATAPGSGKSWAVALMVNGSASTLTCTVSDTNTSAQDTTHSVSLSAGDYVTIRFTPSGTPTAPGTVFWTLRQDATSLFAVVGSNVSAPTSGTSYMSPQSRTLIGSTDALAQIVMPTSGTLKNLYFWAKAAPGVGTGWTLLVYKNGSTTLLTCSILNTATSANDVVPTDGVTVAAGDTISIQIATTGTPISQPIGYSMSFDPDTDGESFLAFNGNGIQPSTSATQYNNPTGGDTSWNATESNRYTRLAASTIKAIWASTSVSPGVSPKAYTFTARVAGVDSSAAVTINDASTAAGSTRVGGTTGQFVSVLDDNTLTIKSVPTSTPIAVFAKVSLLTYLSPLAASSLTDDFNDNSIDSSKWTSSAGTGVTVSETNQELEIATGTTAGNYGALTSNNYYYLIGSSVSTKLIDIGNAALPMDCFVVLVTKDTNNLVFWNIDTGTLNAGFTVGGVDDIWRADTAYSSATHKYFRILESAGTIYFDYSANGSSWTTYISAPTTTATFDLNSVKIGLKGGIYSGSTGTTQKLDNFNLLSSNYTSSLTGALSFTGAQTKAITYPQISSLTFTGALARAMVLRTLLTSAALSFTGTFAKTTQKPLQATLELQNLVPNGNFENAPISNVAATTTPNVWINGTVAGSSASSAYGWATISVTSSASAGFDTAQKRSGTYSMKLSTLNATGQMTVGSFPSSPSVDKLFVMKPNTRYTLSGWIMTTNVVTNGAFIDVRQYTSGLSTITTNSSNKLSGTNGWTQVSVTFTSDATAAFGNVFLRNNVAGNVSDAWFDDVTLVQITPRNPFVTVSKQLSASLSSVGAIARGGMPMRLTGALSFAGSLFKSTSKSLSAVASFTGAVATSLAKLKALTGSLSYTGSLSKTTQVPLKAGLNQNNLRPNGSFEVPPANNTTATGVVNRWIDGSANGSSASSGYSWATPSLNGTAQASFDSTTAHSGNYSLKLSTLSTSTDNIVVGNYRLTPSDGVVFRLTPSIQYTLSGWMKTNNVVNNGAFIDVREYDSGYTPITTTSSAKLSGTNNWTQVSFTFTAQNNTVYANIFLRNNIAGNVSDVWFDDIVLAPTAPNFVYSVSRALSGALSFTGTLYKVPSRVFTASVAFAGSFIKKTNRLLNGYFSFAVPPDDTGSGMGGGSLGGDPLGGGYSGILGSGFTKTTMRALTAATTFTGSLNKTMARIQNATISFTGNLSKRYSKALTGVLTASGTLTPSTIHRIALNAALNATGALNKRTLRTLSGAASFTGSLGKRINYIHSATLAFTGTLTKSYRKALAATLTTNGSLVPSTVRVVALTATLTATGALSKRAARSFTAVASFAGAIKLASTYVLTASITPSGSLNKRFARNLTAALTPTGALTRTLARALGATLGLSGTFSKVMQKAFAGTIAPIGSLLYSSMFKRAFTASITPSGSLGKRFARNFTGGVNFTGGIVKQIARNLSAGVGFIGDLLHLFAHKSYPAITADITIANQYVAIVSTASYDIVAEVDVDDYIVAEVTS